MRNKILSHISDTISGLTNDEGYETSQLAARNKIPASYDPSSCYTLDVFNHSLYLMHEISFSVSRYSGPLRTAGLLLGL